jgi:hypothetical protein
VPKIIKRTSFYYFKIIVSFAKILNFGKNIELFQKY